MNSENYVLRFDSMTRILYVNGVRFEDLEPLEKNMVLGLLFKGGQERATIEGERNEVEAQLVALIEAHENLKLNFRLLAALFALIFIASLSLGSFLWFS